MCVAYSYATGVSCAAALLRLDRLRLGNGVVGSLGGSLMVSLSPSSVSFVTLRPEHQLDYTPEDFPPR